MIISIKPTPDNMFYCWQIINGAWDNCLTIHKGLFVVNGKSFGCEWIQPAEDIFLEVIEAMNTDR